MDSIVLFQLTAPTIGHAVLYLWLLAINIIAFAMMGVDKRKARKRRHRISEKALFLSALLGGSLGALLGMLLFRHKTRHWSFRIGIPVILIAQILIPLLVRRL